MIRYLFESDGIYYVYLGLLAVGLLLRMILHLLYSSLLKASENLGETRNKYYKHMKMKFEACYKLKIGVNNVDTFVDKSLVNHRFSGILLSTWENICGQILLSIFLIIPVYTIFAVVYGYGQDHILDSGGVGILFGSVLIFVDKAMNLSVRKTKLRLNLLDYLDNFCKIRLEQEVFHPQQLEQYRQEYFLPLERDKQAAAAKQSEEPKNELHRRRQARERKEEEKRKQAAWREEENKRLESLRQEEERKKQEERRALAAKRREEERRQVQLERDALEQRKAELKRKSEERIQENIRKKQQEKESSEMAELETAAAEDEMFMNKHEELSAGKEEQHLTKANMDSMKRKISETIGNGMTAQEEKLIEDILKEFFT